MKINMAIENVENLNWEQQERSTYKGNNDQNSQTQAETKQRRPFGLTNSSEL